ncbi:MAG TPA: GNAT family N-acetyltransferase [Thermoanaerobaculia bacterium]
MEFREIAFGSEDYERERRLRDEVLRRPLGLSLADEDSTLERDQLHYGLFGPGLFDGVETLIACVLAAPISPIEARIRQMAVSPAHQGKGLGRRLLDEVESDLRARGFRRLQLSARSTAVGFYEKLGYATLGEEYVSVTVPHVRMMKAL